MPASSELVSMALSFAAFFSFHVVTVGVASAVEFGWLLFSASAVFGLGVIGSGKMSAGSQWNEVRCNSFKQTRQKCLGYPVWVACDKGGPHLLQFAYCVAEADT